MTPEKAQLARKLFAIGAIKFGEFRLALHDKQPDAPLSPIYLNLRTEHHPNPDKRGPLTDEVMDQIGGLFSRISLLPRFDRYVGLPDAGEPFAEQMERIGWAQTRLHLHKEPGTRNIADMVDGEYQHGDACLLIDDLITQADSKLNAFQVLERNGLNVAGALVLVDRLQGGARQLGERGYKLRSVFRLDELLEFYVEQGLIGQMKAEDVMRYIAANQVQ